MTNQDPPIGRERLRDLFEFLDRKSSTGHECDHTFTLCRRFLEDQGLAVDSMLTWLGENGAGCDCEVMFNTAAEWEETVGYEPPGEDD